MNAIKINSKTLYALAGWFILQHLRRYKPFFTKIRFEKIFEGDLSIGRTARQKIRDDLKELKYKELNQKTRNDMWRESKF